ncbi:YIP1 family protein [Granulicella cerasi]|uniref:YIP1 family protein n=1 Tax=Granulicella cerasi TaxID=741063 RepID=A0ABW1Z8I3_9BACT|nr:YIP1 family protein [Granulicella cerasi]
MSDYAMPTPVPAAAPLNEIERVVDTFVAPTKTFTDILRSSSWWLPFIIVCVLAFTSTFTVGKKVGWEAVTQQQMASSKSAQAQMNQLTPEQRAQRIHMGAKVSSYIGYAVPVMVLLFSAVIVLVLWLSVNFGLGAETTYGQMFAVFMYAGLPKLGITLLNIILLWAGVGLDNYDIKNPVGTNLGYYLNEAPKWLQTLGSYFDIFNLWALFLLVLGVSIVAKKTKGQAAAVVVGWWALILLINVAWVAVMG